MYNKKYIIENSLEKKEKRKNVSGSFLKQPFFIAVCSFLFCWLYVAFYIPRYISTAGADANGQNVFFLSQHSFVFGGVLLLFLLPGLLMRESGGLYLRCLTLAVLIVTACLSWRVAKPSEHLAGAINGLLEAPCRQNQVQNKRNLRQEKKRSSPVDSGNIKSHRKGKRPS